MDDVALRQSVFSLCDEYTAGLSDAPLKVRQYMSNAVASHISQYIGLRPERVLPLVRAWAAMRLDGPPAVDRRRADRRQGERRRGSEG